MEAPASLTSSDSSNSGNSYVFESDLSSDASDYEEIPEVGHFVFDPLATSSSDDDDESVAEDDGDVVRDDAEEADNAQWHGLEWSRPPEMLGTVKSQGVRVGYNNKFGARAYVDEVNQRYKPVTAFQQEALHGIFQSDLVQGKTLLEVGCGPMLWPSFLSSRRFSDIVLSDLMEGNRLELEKCLEKSKDAIDWTSRAEEVAALEGYSDTKKGALEILERTRSSIRKVVHGDVLKPGVLPQEHEEAFDVVLSCNCIECAIADYESFRCAVCNVGSLVKPGGLLVLAGMGGPGKFTIGDHEFPMVIITDDVVKGAVADSGFKLSVYRMENMGAMGQPELFAFVLAARKYCKGDL